MYDRNRVNDGSHCEELGRWDDVRQDEGLLSSNRSSRRKRGDREQRNLLRREKKSDHDEALRRVRKGIGQRIGTAMLAGQADGTRPAVAGRK